jgi:hypothetical protein
MRIDARKSKPLQPSLPPGIKPPSRQDRRSNGLGLTPKREDILRGFETAEILLGFEGIAGDVHEGATRSSCSRVTQLYPLNTEIRNTRQLTILSTENLAEIARDMGLEKISPELVGANVVVENIPDLSHLTPSSRLQSESGTTIVVDRLNQPCTYPARSIEKAHPGFGKLFRRAAEGRRGVTAWVERPGVLKIGDRLRLHVPRHRAWEPEQSAGV